jgi:hypothetical protein
MKSAVLLLLSLVACAGSPAPEPAITPTLVPDCSSCPTCDKQVSPTCPECPKSPACSKPAEPVAVDWHCMELNPPREKSISYCWPSSSVCEGYRQKALKKPKKWGAISACSPHRTAYCFYRGDPTPMSRQTLCALTLEHCEEHRRLHSKTDTTETTYLSACEPTLNTDTFIYDDNGKALNYLP